MSTSERAKVWAGMLAGALERGDYAGAQGYARQLEAMAGELRAAPRCYCPDDCNCRHPWRHNYCGCKLHIG